MRQHGWLLAVAVCAGLATGCVDRRFVITSDPPGAIVYRDGKPIGPAPADDHFTYYGCYEFTLVKDGYETLHVKQPVEQPWYEFIGLDFFTENLLPWRIEDVRRFNYAMTPLPIVRSDQLLNDAEALKNRARIAAPPDAVPRPQ